MDEYERVGPAGDPVLRALPRVRRAVASHEVAPEGAWRELPFYATLARAGLHATLQAPLLDGDMLIGTLNVARGRDEPPFGAGELVLLSLLGRHVAAAYRRAARFDALRAR